MADYWKSNERKYCDFCKCWIADNKSSVQFHENGKRHQMNVQKRISEISRNSYKAQHEQSKIDADLKKMNDAAMKAYMLDISAGADISSRELCEKQKLEQVNANADQIGPCAGPSVNSSGITDSRRSKTKKGREADPLYLPGLDSDEDPESSKGKAMAKKRRIEDDTKVDPESMWVEAENDDGFPYYWNVKTGESVWEPPKEGYMKKDEYENLSKIAWQKQKENAALEAKYELENADEIAARLRRENMAQIFKHNRKIKEEIEKKVDHGREAASNAEIERSKNPYGRWESVQVKQEQPMDLQLPVTPAPLYVPSAQPEKAEPKFKEKVIDHVPLDAKSTTSDTFMKKRKIQRQSRQRLDAD
ncbi:WW domain-binding protein 4 [Anopheles moucheti]|uniref:WW domain-binding protein 4 n=1 Tax=Anopheles moucheti TaxID=186751 RepID=UPI0022F12EC7|nr:WW domain-binding protein 4 [Anopheles moucheti]XP_052903620.1 WW domain-binding protein 4 [Anopheles moucheti]